MESLFKNLPDIIVAASKSPLGICALTVIALSIISFFFFRNSSNLVKITNFILLIIATALIVIIGAIVHFSPTSFSPTPSPSPEPTRSFSPDPPPNNVSSQIIVGTWQAKIQATTVTVYINPDKTFVANMIEPSQTVNAKVWGQYTTDSQYTYLRCENFDSNNAFMTAYLQTYCPNRIFSQFTIVDNNNIKEAGGYNYYRIR